MISGARWLDLRQPNQRVLQFLSQSLSRLLRGWTISAIYASSIHFQLQNKVFIDIRLRLGIATPLVTHRHTAHYGQT